MLDYILKCPKCKNQAWVEMEYYGSNDLKNTFYVRCNCDLQSPKFRFEIEAVSWWNRKVREVIGDKPVIITRPDPNAEIAAHLHVIEDGQDG